MSDKQTPSSRAIVNSILWGMIIPQFFLVALNIRSWTLIRGEANQDQTNYALALFALELAIISFTALIYWLHKAAKVRLGWTLALVSLIIHVSYMWGFLIGITTIIPDTIQPWILSEGNVGRWTITLFMPGAFLSLYALSKSFFSKISATNGGLIVLLTTIGMPLAWYLVVSLMQPTWFGQVTIVIIILATTTMVVLFLGGIIRFFDNIIHTPTTTTLVEKHYIIAILIGLAAPLGGLALNHSIAFPVNFQSIAVYALTVVNGLVLLLKAQGQTYAPVRLFTRCIVYPFIFYFFLVFLPFLPLSLMAILAVGAGFLMLTPLALGLFQTKLTLDEYKLAKAKVGAQKAVFISILGLSVLPSYFLVQAFMDKNALNTSLEYFYSHDTSAERLSESQISRSADALVQLKDRKMGIQLPYIAGFYNAVVFGDLVLSDKKISKMYSLLTGKALPVEDSSMFGPRRSSHRTLRRGGFLAPKQAVEIQELTMSQLSKEQSTVKLVLKNNSSDTHSLFVGQLDIPEGVFISGLRLKIEGEWVTGRIFDRKTALWVFQKITEVRRDPALLYYQSAQHVQLRVYPFPSMGVRELEIDFQHHSKIDSKITIAGQEVDLNPAFNAVSIVSQSGTSLVSDNISELAFKREPYIHFILDYSNTASADDRQYAESIIKVREKLGISEFRVTAANIGVSKSNTDRLLDATDLQNLSEHIKGIALPKMGGLWLQQAIAKEILQIQKTISFESFHRTPIFVVLSNESFDSDTDLGLDTWSWLIPDLLGWHSYAGGNLQFHAFQGNSASKQNRNIVLNAVIAIQQDSGITILPANQSSILDTATGEKLSVYNHSLRKFSSPAVLDDTLSVNSKWADYAQIWVNWRTTNLNPAEIELQRSAFLSKSRAHNMLLPLSSLIVVESPSQWEILKRKEKQSLSNHSGLDFEEEQQTPEPPWWLLLAGLLIFIYSREKRTAGYESPS